MRSKRISRVYDELDGFPVAGNGASHRWKMQLDSEASETEGPIQVFTLNH